MALRIKHFRGLLVLFIVVTALSIVFKDRLAEKKIDYLVVMGANAILFILSMISLVMHAKAVTNKNPNAFVRSIMAANIIKLLGVAMAAFIYIQASTKETRSVNAIFIALGLYIIYTWLEKKATLQINKSKQVTGNGI